MRHALIPSFIAAALAALGLVACTGGGSSLLNSSLVPGRSSVSDSPTASPAPLIYVANFEANTVTAYVQTDNGNVSPQVTASSGLGNPTEAVLDGAGNLFVINQTPPQVHVFSIGDGGALTPSKVVSCGGLGPDGAPFGGAFDKSGNFYVSSGVAAASLIAIFPPGSSGCVTGNAVVQGSDTLLSGPLGIAINNSQRVYVANQYSSSITIYSPGPSGDAAPLCVIAGSLTELTSPSAIAFDDSGNLYVANFVYGSSGSITEYAPNADGNVAPIRMISGPDTGINTPYGLAVGNSGEIYLSNRFGPDSIEVFAPGASGDVAPIRVIGGNNTGLNQPEGLSLYYPLASAQTKLHSHI